MNSVSIALVSVALVLAVPGTCAAEPWTLGSGKTVDILSLGPAASPQGRPSLQLTYQTLVPLTDAATLRKEADEIWDRLANDADDGLYDRAIISAHAPATGGGAADADAAVSFVFERREGSWRTPESKERVQKKLDVAFVREFIDRIKWAGRYDHRNASLLYLAEDWLLTVTGPKPDDLRIFDRAGGVALDHLTREASIEDADPDENISLDKSGTVAHLQGRFDAIITLNGRRIHAIGHETDDYQLQGDLMLMMSAQVVLEERTEASAN